MDTQRLNSRSYPPPTRSLARQLLPVAHESSHGPASDEPVLQTTPGTLERIVDRKINVGVALVGIRLVANIDFLFVRQSEPDMDLEKTAGPVVLPWTFQHYTAGRNSAEAFLKLGHVSRDGCAQHLLRFHSLKFDVHWGFHL
jgi:hypothetical protein